MVEETGVSAGLSEAGAALGYSRSSDHPRAALQPRGPQLGTPRSTITATQHLWALASPSAVPTPLCLITHSSCSFAAPTHPSLLLTQGFNLELSFCVSLLLPLMPTLILSPCLRFKFCRRKDLNCSVGPRDPYGLDFPTRSHPTIL